MQTKKKYLVLIASFVVLLTGLMPAPTMSLNGNAYELTIGNIGEPESLDPHWMYDSASMEFLHNVIECLVDYDGESVEEFIPELATDWVWDEGTLTYTFTIREGVQWHDPAYGTVTPEDVEYSIERAMVMDHGGGPQWMIYEPLFGAGFYGADLSDPNFINRINDKVTVSGNQVSFHFETPFPPLIFLQTFSQVWAGIIDKEWAIEQGCWDGVYTEESLLAYYDPAVSPLMDPDPVCMGTGPFKFDEWSRGSGGYWTIVKNDDYWGGWPAYSEALGANCRGYVTRVTSNYVEEWATRKLMFLAGDLDVCYVPRLYMMDVWGQPGIECVYPNLEISADGFFMNVNISLNSRYLRPPFSVELDYGQLSPDGIPPDFFGDIDVRRAFAHSVDYPEYIDIAFLGEGSYPATPSVVGLPYRRDDAWYAANAYQFDAPLATQYFQSAFGGQLWDTGFKLTLLYNEGNEPRRVIAEMLEENIEALNPLFNIEVQSAPWGEVMIPELFNGELTTFVIGWHMDYPDPHNFYHPFFHSTGVFAEWQNYGNDYVDSLISAGAGTTDPAERQAIYYELQELYISEVPSVTTLQGVGRQWQRDWVQGWFFNPGISGMPGVYNYHLWKEELPLTDTNDDGNVDIFDVVNMAKAFGSYYSVGDVHPSWDSTADLNLDKVVDIFDVVTIAKDFGFSAPTWTPPS